MNASFQLTFPAISGVQARRQFYVSMCALRLIPKIFTFNEEDSLPAELRAQRVLNKSRLPEIAHYILGNRDNYTFSALTASIDGDVQFEPLGAEGDAQRIGLLRVHMSAKFIINDGQHRRAAIEMALRDNPELAEESIAVVFFHDQGLERCQQMFADLNRHAIRPGRSLGLLYDHRDEDAQLVRQLVFQCPVFRNVVEMERSTLSPRSRRLFTLSAIHTATVTLLANMKDATYQGRLEIATSFWTKVDEQFKEWQLVRDREMPAGDVRDDVIHSHGVILHALGRVGDALLREDEKGWPRRLKRLQSIDWSRSNKKLWEGRAMSNGGLSNSERNVTLTANAIKQHLGLTLTPEEQRMEDALGRGDHAGK